MAYILALVMAVAQIAALVAVVMLGVSLTVRTRRSAALWLLAVITRRKLPLATELEALGDGLLTSDRGRVNAAASRVRAGASLAEALSAAPGLIPDDAVVLAHVGERSGRLGETLAAEAERLARAREAAVVSTTSPSLALLYLVGVPLVIPVIVTGLMIFIIPKYKKIFSDFGIALPPATEELIDSSDFIAQYWYLVAASMILAASVAGVLFVLSRAYAWDFRFPGWMWPGGRSRRSSLVLRAFAVPAAAGRPMTDALDPLANTAGDGLTRRRFERLRERFRAGEKSWDALAAERLVTHRDADLLTAAERAGNLAWALNMLADRFDDRRRRRLAVLVEIVQPAVVLCLGAFVLFICLGMFLPLVQLLNDLS